MLKLPPPSTAAAARRPRGSGATTRPTAFCVPARTKSGLRSRPANGSPTGLKARGPYSELDGDTDDDEFHQF
ncbi:hypothetical protein EVAR_60222_1 [Eumeta japonica]|uniref:Uncharacterized protein n=1 Tax=Eumeta variegata TaxID=151549 RepID=A0A4C1Z8R2_EUMVA|nr:hypothetical protein EVAR_60222_1 [Eumeta japonica]